MSTITEKDWFRFFKKVNMADNGCWEWTACCINNGYSLFCLKNKKILGHRFAYMGAKGTIPTNAEIDHLCRNRKCVNPAHLEAVSKQENARRTIGKRYVAYCKRGHSMGNGNRYIGPNQTFCRKCATATRKAYKERIKERGNVKP